MPPPPLIMLSASFLATSFQDQRPQGLSMGLRVSGVWPETLPLSRLPQFTVGFPTVGL